MKAEEPIEWGLVHWESLSAGELVELLRLRQRVFVVEQECAYNDIDGRDPLALHLLGRIRGSLAAYARIFPPGTLHGDAAIGRVVTDPSVRGAGIGRALMVRAMAEVSSAYPTSVVRLQAQQYLEHFYNGLGFLTTSVMYLEDGIPHIDMMLPAGATTPLGSDQPPRDHASMTVRPPDAEEIRHAYDATIEGWAFALELRDRETEGHSRRVSGLTVELARRMGVPPMDLVHVRRGALLHDIGKMAIPDSVLLKEGPLTEDEWILMRQHPDHARRMLEPIAFLHPALAIPQAHHERWDGSGYPLGLKGEAIPLHARIFAVVDVWDAITNRRAYREPWSVDKALEHLRESSGTLFDPRVVEVFEQMILEGQR